ncbi:lipopolysaccharide biosynthesis protein [Gordonibacter sp. An230]|uniref:lipopolysaccharide biosynthesis protein n=1 Tax=Gordonibacter sp. An230 TaxID=1965592 RepID=UPI00112276D4|nr:hypothetical protein [Gordonibacter sp. An230]
MKPRFFEEVGRHPVLLSMSADFLLSLAAVALSTGAMQLFLYPQMALKLGPVEYGEVLTVVGVVNVVTLSLGNNLTSSRLVRQHVYEDSGEAGDFQALLVVSSVASVGIVAVYCALSGMALAEGVAVAVFALTTVLKSYYLVAFRIVIDYRKNLVANVFLCVGYVVGAFFLLGLFSWPWSFTLANIACIAYVMKASRIAFEPFRITRHFRSTFKSYSYLVGGGLLGNLSTYLDRFIVNPILGVASVSTYTVATFFPKGLSLALAPLAGVLLSYVSQGRISFDKRKFILVNVAILVFCFVLLAFSVTLGRWITQFFYPTIYDEAEPYIALAAVGVALGIGNSYNGTVVLAVAAPVWQTVIPAASLAIYFGLSVALASSIGLWGVCYASVASNALRFFVNLALGFWAIGKREAPVEEQLC